MLRDMEALFSRPGNCGPLSGFQPPPVSAFTAPLPLSPSLLLVLGDIKLFRPGYWVQSTGVGDLEEEGRNGRVWTFDFHVTLDE